eukprot:TRINITY_DN9299_c0_g1_i1.p1 TRINITY_DN9299_c0_g1~~TRINITY_DN9299_c0_g1_i1.p1  ORF type:complete len:181 (+),score=53.24 TRINITY_DN9299_c0_g1_i1:82-624(+)
MGSSSSQVPLEENVVGSDGEKCIVSAAFDEFCTPEEFFDAFCEWFKVVKSPIDGSDPKDLKVDEDPGKEITATATWDGDLTRKAAYIYTIKNVPDAGDYVTVRVATLDRSSLSFKDKSSSGGAGDQKADYEATGRVLKEPARFEWFCIENGERVAGGPVLKTLQAVVDTVLEMAKKKKEA